MIRTSGELRLSNFLPWQLVYSEFLFLDKNWPDFEEEDLDKAMLLIINDVTKYLIEQGKLIAIESIETRNKLLLNIKGEN